jgi:glycosyltransferase involved in cell wall biosynthesis
VRLLHITPHLGGGVGKAHAAIAAALPEGIEQTFLLLEAPRDTRHVDALTAAGARVMVADGPARAAHCARSADIVQFEFWNHPRLLECLARCDFPAMRSVFWSHISGLARPFVPPGLIGEAGRFVFTTAASLALPAVAALDGAARRRVAAINSGFGFEGLPRRRPAPGRPPSIAYLGTVDFAKMHPGFFDAVDALVGGDIRVDVWGAPSEAATARARRMRNPQRVSLRGQTADPAAALSDADIFFYPLQPDHYGTAENALIEAMSLGLTPVVLGNPAERAIVRDGETGFIAESIEECVSLLQMLLLLPELRDRISRNAARHVAERRAPVQSVQDFMILWLGLMAEPPRHCDFRSALGESPADWFLATQGAAGAWPAPAAGSPEIAAKGTLAHFEQVFAADESLARLRRPGTPTPATRVQVRRAIA